MPQNSEILITSAIHDIHFLQILFINYMKMSKLFIKNLFHTNCALISFQYTSPQFKTLFA